jgi:predicted TIM-barrel fold metal-dependent hydrolase
LIHGAFPYHEEVGFLANRPNVHVDISLFNIFAPLRVGERILRVLDLAPAGKVLFGTDGFNEPELFWFAAVVLRDAWAAARADLRDAGARRTWIDEMERMMFETNARELYGI